MFEVEVKRSIRKVRSVETRILELGGELVSESLEEDLYLNHPCRNFSETDEALRIRRVGRRVYLTYKGSKIGKKGKVRVEKSVRVDSFKSTVEILQSLGFKSVGVPVKKFRKSYKVGDLKVNIDKVYGLGEYIEVEGLASSKREIPKILKKCKELLESLGLSGRNIRKSYLEMLLAKRYA